MTLAHRRQLGDDLCELVGDVDGLAVVVVAVAGDQHLRLDLAEAVEHALHAEVGRAGRPHRADRRRRQHADDALGHVGQDGGDPVAGADARLAQRRSLRATSALSSFQLMRRLTLSSPQNTSAVPAPSLRSRFSAKLSRASGKKRAPASGRDRRDRPRAGVALDAAQSQISFQKAAGSSIEKACKSS